MDLGIDLGLPSIPPAKVVGEWPVSSMSAAVYPLEPSASSIRAREDRQNISDSGNPAVSSRRRLERLSRGLGRSVRSSLAMTR